MTQKNVDIIVRGKDQSGPALKSAKSGLDRLAAAQKATAARRDLFKNTEDSARALRDEYVRAAEAAQQLGIKTAGGTRGTKAQKAAFEEARNSARALKTEFLAVGTSLAQLQGRASSSRGSFGAFDATAASLRSEAIAAGQAEAAVESLTRDLPAMAAAQQRAAGATRNATTALQGQTRGVADFADRETKAIASRKGRGFLGLRPFELQNLSYQINDVFTQLASGTPPMQVFAQQSSQIAQLFPRLIGGFIRFGPAIAVATLFLKPFADELGRTNQEASRLAASEQLLTRFGNGALYTKEQIAALATILDRYGGSLADARAALAEFVQDGVDPAYLERFGKAATNLAKVMKIDVTDAAKQVSDAFTGNAEDVLRLDDQLGFLTRAERQHIEKLKESKREAEARTYAFAIFERKQDEAASKIRNVWAPAVDYFTNAWRSFSDFITSGINFDKLKGELSGLASILSQISDLIGRIPGARGTTQAATQSQLDRLDREIAQDRRTIAMTPRGSGFRNSAERRLADRERQRKTLSDRAALQGLAEGTNPIAQFQPLAQPRDTTLDPPRPPGGGRGRTGKTDEQRRAEAQAKFLADLEAENVARQFQLSLVDQTARESQVLEAIEQARLRAAEVGLTLTEGQEEAIRASVTSLYDGQKAQEALALVERTRLELAERRGEVESEGAFVQRKLKEEGLAGTAELNAATGEVVVTLSEQAKAYEVLLRQIYALDAASRARAEKEKAVNDQLALRDQLMESISFYEESGDYAIADTLRQQLVGVNSELLLAIDNMIAFLSTLTGPEAAAALTRMNQLRAGIAATGSNAVTTGKEINMMIVEGGARAFDQFAQSIAEGANVLSSLRDAFLQFAADFLRQIAQMIIKQVILNAVSGGTPGGGGGVGGAIASAITGLFKHTGGTVGSQGGRRSMPLAAFAGATRYHTGGIAGLMPNEVPAILQAGEEVLTKGDPRHRNNGGGAAASLSAKIVNLFDINSLAEAMLSSETGQKVILNMVRANPRAFQAALNS